MNKVFSSNNEYLSRSGNVISIYLICSWILKIIDEAKRMGNEEMVVQLPENVCKAGQSA